MHDQAIVYLELEMDARKRFDALSVCRHLNLFLNEATLPAVIAVQQLEEWAKADPVRQEFLLRLVAAVEDRPKRSR